MARIASEQVEWLRREIARHDFLQRVLRELDSFQRIVFHANENADWGLVARSAEQLLMAEITCRYHGDPMGIFFALRNMEDSGKPWDAAIHELAGNIHSYYTTPLGMMLRVDLFGDEAIFISTDAEEWMRRRSSSPSAGAASKKVNS